MKALKKYELDQVEVLKYFMTNLEGLNTLSTLVLQNTPFSKGSFFTFLNNKISFDQLYEFNQGGVGERNKDCYIDFVQEQLSKSNESVCMFDCIDQKYDPMHNWDLIDKVGVHLERELYFAVSANDCSEKILLKCFRASDCIWHSLIVLCKRPFDLNINQSVTSKELEYLARNASYILVRAYDMEGYIIWEKKGE